MLKGTIKSIEGDRVTVEFSDGQPLVLSTADIDGVSSVGAEIVLAAAVPGSGDAARMKLAQDLLNNLLNG